MSSTPAEYSASTTPVQELQLADDLFEAVRQGFKQATVRRGARNIQEGPLTLVGARDNALRQDVTVLAAAVMPLREMPDDVAQLDGAANAAGMLDVLSRHYDDITLDSVVTVVIFERPAAA